MVCSETDPWPASPRAGIAPLEERLHAGMIRGPWCGVKAMEFEVPAAPSLPPLSPVLAPECASALSWHWRALGKLMIMPED